MPWQDQLQMMKQRAKTKLGFHKSANPTSPLLSPTSDVDTSPFFSRSRKNSAASSTKTVAAAVIDAFTDNVSGTSSGTGLSFQVPPSTAKSLWEQAVEKLTPEDRNAFDFDNPDKRNTLLEVIGAVELKKEESINKQWKFRKLNGEEVILRSVIDGLLTCLDKYAIIGDVAIQHSPGGGVALAWGGFRFLLQVALNDVETLANIIIALKYITHTLGRCAIYEFLYTKDPSQLESAQHLVSSLPDLYASILKYLCSSKRFFESNTAVRIVIGALNPYIVAFQPLIDEIKVQEARVEKDARVAGEEFQQSAVLRIEKQSSDQQKRTQELQSILKEMQLPLSEIQSEVTKIGERIRKGFEDQKGKTEEIQRVVEETRQQIEIRITEADTASEEKERLAILMWLSKITFEDHHSFVCSNRLAGTGEWLLQKPEFIHWENAVASSILWLHGIAGAGKTKLASFVIDTFAEARDQEDLLAYFYCNYKEDERQNPESILRAIVKQLSTIQPGSSLPESLIRTYQARKEGGFKSGDLRLDESQNLILELTKSCRRMFIVIDALDECEKSTRHLLLQVLQYILNNSVGQVKVFVTSRDDDDIVLHLDGSPNVYIRPNDNSNDINNFIETEIERCISEKKLLRGSVTPELKELIISTLIDGAHGMFLWAHLQILSICKEKTAPAIEKALTSLPSDLREAFSDILSRIEDQTSDSSLLAKKALVFMMCAQRPLSPDELIEALRIEPKKKEWNKTNDGLTSMTILDVCQNLVVIDASETVHVLRFAHLSVQDFLKERFDSSKGHAQVAEICLTFLCWPNHAAEDLELEERAKHHALADYSTKNWAVHVRLSGIPISETLMDLQKEFLSPCRAYTAWCLDPKHEHQGLEFTRGRNTPVAPLLVACYYGLSDICRYLLSTSRSHKGEVDVNCKDHRGLTPLWWAVANGHIEVTRQLLQEEGVDVNCKDRLRRTPLSMAADRGHETLVEMLLQTEGVDINRKDQHRSTPLMLAVKGGHTEVARRLLQAKGVDINARDKYGWTPLSNAAVGGHQVLVELLLGTDGVDVNCEDQAGMTLLMWATKNGKIKLAWQLLGAKDVDVNCRDERGRTPLFVALKEGNGMLMSVLLQAEGVDVNCEDHSGSTPLMWATQSGYTEVARHLLRAKGVDVNCKDARGRTPLLVALEGGHEELVAILLQAEKVDVNCCGNDGWTPLLWAAEYRKTELAQHLLRTKDVNVNCKDKSGRTPLLVALERGHNELVEALLKVEGVDVNCCGNDGWTPLFWAAESGQIELTRQLLRIPDVAVNTKDERGWTPLFQAVVRGHEALIKVLLQAESVDVNCRDLFDSTPLLWAAKVRRIEITKQLLQAANVDVNCKDKNGRTPLSVALKGGHDACVEELIQASEVDGSCRDDNGRRLLYWAVERRDVQLIRRLLQLKGVKADLLLLHAAKRGYIEVVEYLLQAEGVDVNVNCEVMGGGTPLHLAAHYGHEDVVKELLQVEGVNVNLVRRVHVRRRERSVADVVEVSDSDTTDSENECEDELFGDSETLELRPNIVRLLEVAGWSV